MKANAVEFLRNAGRATAKQIAEALSVNIEAVYEQLVKAEARGLVRIDTAFFNNNYLCTWEMNE